jgi:hypothetical protein
MELINGLTFQLSIIINLIGNVGVVIPVIKDEFDPELVKLSHVLVLVILVTQSILAWLLGCFLSFRIRISAPHD